jgi:hypothetical protein
VGLVSHVKSLDLNSEEDEKLLIPLEPSSGPIIEKLVN